MAPIHKNKGARAARRERIEQGLEPRPMPASETALHEAAHAVFYALLDLPGFISTDIVLRGPGQRLPGPKGERVPQGFNSLGWTLTVMPEILTPDYAYKAVLGYWAPEALAQLLKYDDIEGTQSDRQQTGTLAARALGITDGPVGIAFADRMFRPTCEILSDPAVLAGVMNVAQALDRKKALTADQVREIVALYPVRPLPDEVQKLISAPVLARSQGIIAQA